MEYKPKSPNQVSTTTSRPSSSSSDNIRPRIIIHGGAGNISHDNLPPEQWSQYRSSLLSILRSTKDLLTSPSTTALTAATHAVRLLEEDPLFNCGRGAVFTRTGHIEHEASVMVTKGHRKRGIAVSMLSHVKSPIGLCAELLRRGDDEGVGPEENAQGHVHLSGEYLEGLAKRWGVEMVDESWFWTRKRWEEHIKGLEREKRGREKRRGQAEAAVRLEAPGSDKAPVDVEMDLEHLSFDTDLRPDGKPWPSDDPTWDGVSYLPQGTVGCLVLDRFGTICTATSTGGLTNKLPGRIGDTPTMGAGFWAEEWTDPTHARTPAPMSSLGLLSTPSLQNTYITRLVADLRNNGSSSVIPSFITDCLPLSTSRQSSPTTHDNPTSILNEKATPFPSRTKSSSSSFSTDSTHAVAMSGTGNGDSFLQLCAARTVAAAVRYSSLSRKTSPTNHRITLATSIKAMAGPGGELQKSAGERWGVTGEGVGGIIGIELKDGEGEVCFDFNGGMFRAWVDDAGRERVEVFREEEG